MWLQEFSTCSCLTALPGPAWVLLSKTFKPFRPTQYFLEEQITDMSKKAKARLRELATVARGSQNAGSRTLVFDFFDMSVYRCRVGLRLLRKRAFLVLCQLPKKRIIWHIIEIHIYVCQHAFPNLISDFSTRSPSTCKKFTRSEWGGTRRSRLSRSRRSTSGWRFRGMWTTSYSL